MRIRKLLTNRKHCPIPRSEILPDLLKKNVKHILQNTNTDDLMGHELISIFLGHVLSPENGLNFKTSIKLQGIHKCVLFPRGNTRSLIPTIGVTSSFVSVYQYL